MFLYTSKLPEAPTFVPSFDDTVAAERRQSQAAGALWDATRDLQLYRDNANAEDMAMGEAYQRRNKAIFEATGVQLPNPRRDFDARELQEAARLSDAGGDPWAVMQEREAAWQRRAADLARQQPKFAAVIGLDKPIRDDAFAIARGAEEQFGRASAEAQSAGVGTVRQLANSFGGGFAGMLRDPMQVATLFAGGSFSAPAKSVFGRIVQSVLTEGAVNAGVEAGVQLAAEDWRRRAGTEHGLAPALQQVGLAALFGGGFGGLLQGGQEVFRAVGRAAPEGVLERLDNPQPGDIGAIADALGVRLDDEMRRAADLAVEQAALDQDAFGPPPAGVADPEALAAQAIRAIEGERAGQVDRIVRTEFPLGAEPKRPVSLMQFLASRDVGGLVDHGGEHPARATATSTVDDLLRALRAEAGGEPVFSPRNDGGRIFDWQEFQSRKRGQDAYRRVVDDVSGAISELGIEHSLDDTVVRRAAMLVDDETDAAAALERALDEDYRSYADAFSERGEDFADETDIPFFGQEDPGAVPDAGRQAGQPRGDGEGRGRGDDAPDGERLSRAGPDEGTPARNRRQSALDGPGSGDASLKQAGDTPEPATPEAAEIAGLALTEATPAGQQQLIPGVKPVSTKEKLEAQAAKPMKGGDAAMPEGGLFDLDAQNQIDIWDAMPAAKTADGQTLSATHETMTADADRAGLFSDLISSCKD